MTMDSYELHKSFVVRLTAFMSMLSSITWLPVVIKHQAVSNNQRTDELILERNVTLTGSSFNPYTKNFPAVPYGPGGKNLH
jgi:hypothetical protein